MWEITRVLKDLWLCYYCCLNNTCIYLQTRGTKQTKFVLVGVDVKGRPLNVSRIRRKTAFQASPAHVGFTSFDHISTEKVDVMRVKTCSVTTGGGMGRCWSPHSFP